MSKMGPYLFLVLGLFSGTMAVALHEMIIPDQEQGEFKLDDIEHHDHNTTEIPVAFSATFSGKIEDAGAGQHMKFKNVILNDYEGYDPDTGVFRAPVCGVYSFTYVVASSLSTFVDATLVVKNKKINGAYSKVINHKNINQGTNTAIVHLHKGEQVWVEFKQDSSIKAEDELYNSFSGFLLYTRE
ncbi:Elastin microfibril interfacer 2 [Mactra antiquata]